MYLLDTNHCSRAILGDPNIIRHLADAENVLITTCVIVQGELIHMAEQSAQKDNNLVLVQGFLQGIYIYNVDRATANIYGEIKAALFKRFGPKEKTKRRSIKLKDLGFGNNDIWIAAIALQHHLTIVSADSDFERIQQVKNFGLESWI